MTSTELNLYMPVVGRFLTFSWGGTVTIPIIYRLLACCISTVSPTLRCMLKPWDWQPGNSLENAFFLPPPLFKPLTVGLNLFVRGMRMLVNNWKILPKEDVWCPSVEPLQNGSNISQKEFGIAKYALGEGATQGTCWRSKLPAMIAVGPGYATKSRKKCSCIKLVEIGLLETFMSKSKPSWTSLV